MAILIQPTKKRNRPPTHDASASSSSRMSSNKTPTPPDDEYEHAVAFLRDFHSRRVASYSWSVGPSPSSCVSSSSSSSKHNTASVHHHHSCGGATLCCYDKLAPIKEEELRCTTNDSNTISSTKATAVSLDDMLSNDFALALSVDNTNKKNMWNSSAADITPSSSIRSSFYSTSTSTSSCSPRMKKAMTTKCLLDLGRKSSAANIEEKKHDQELESNSAFSSGESVGNDSNNVCSDEEEESVTSSSDCCHHAHRPHRDDHLNHH